MFWLVMTIVDASLFVVFLALAVFGSSLGIGPDRLAVLKRSSWGLLAWAGICAAHYSLAR